MAKVAIVVAMAKNRVIASGDRIPWDVKEDRELFRSLVKGKTAIMGHKTFDLMKPNLPGKHNVVISSTDIDYEGIVSCRNIADAIRIAQEYGNDIFVIGGASIYAQAINLVDEMHISYIKGDYSGDKLFPEFNESEWNVEQRKEFKDFEYVVYSRKRHG